jgi:hypothetical protein
MPTSTIPEDNQMSLPYSDDFSSYSIGDQPKYFYDQAGAFEVVETNGSKCLKQVLTVSPSGWGGGPSDPYTVFGDTRLTNYQVSSDVLLASTGSAYISGRGNLHNRDGTYPAAGYMLKISVGGAWVLNRVDFSSTTSLASGTISSFNSTSWHNLKLKMIDSTITAYVDNTQVASVVDSNIPSGQPAIGCSFNTVLYDNIKIEAIDSSTSHTCIRVNDTDKSITYDSSWYGEDGNWMDYVRSCKKSNTANSTFEYTFTGSGVTLIGRKTSTGGSGDVYIDGTLVSTINTNSSTSQNRAPIFKKMDLSYGKHTIKLVAKGDNYIYLDAIEYLGQISQVTTNTPTATSTTTTTISTLTPTSTPSATTAAISATATATKTSTQTPTATITTSQNTGLVITYNAANDWGSGATVNVTIKNNGTSQVSGWLITWNFAGNQVISNMWGGTYTQSGTLVSAKNESWNSTIPVGGAVSIGFNITYSGTNTKPASCTFNGTTYSFQ